jgi:hypothetical protein
LELPSVDAGENLLSLAGESIKLVNLHAALDQEFPGKIKLSDFFEHRDIAGLAAHLRESSAYGWGYLAAPGDREPRSGDSVHEAWLDTGVLDAMRSLGRRAQADETDIVIGFFAYVVSRACAKDALTVHLVDNAESELVPCSIDFRSLGGFLSLFGHIARMRRAARVSSLPLERARSAKGSRPKGMIAPMVWMDGTPPYSRELEECSGAVMKLLPGESGLRILLLCDSVVGGENGEAWMRAFTEAVDQAAAKTDPNAEPAR